MLNVVEASTRKSPDEGLALLGEELWLGSANFHTAVSGYLAGLPTRSDWLRIRAELHDLLPARGARLAAAGQGDVSLDREGGALDLAVARRWARNDLDAAVQWYAHELTSDGWTADPTTRTVQVLQTVPVTEWSFVSNWIATRRATDPAWDDQVVVHFLRSKNRVTPNPDVERLVALPTSAKDRAEIVAAFATPVDHKDGPALRHSAESLVALIEAAQLPPDDTARWLQMVTETRAPGS